jgi:hypothetical protein
MIMPGHPDLYELVIAPRIADRWSFYGQLLIFEALAVSPFQRAEM